MTSVVARRFRADPARAMAPVDAGWVVLGDVRVGYETFGEGEDTVGCCRRGRSSTRASGRRRSRISLATSGWSRSTPAVTDALIGRSAPRTMRSRSRPSTRSRCSTTWALSVACWSRIAVLRRWRCYSPPSIVNALRGWCSCRRRCRSRRRCLSAPGMISRRCSLSTRVGEIEPPLLAGGFPRLSGVLLLPLLHRAALDQADRGLRPLGAGDLGRDARADDRRPRPRRRPSRTARPHPVPAARHPG